MNLFLSFIFNLPDRWGSWPLSQLCAVVRSAGCSARGSGVAHPPLAPAADAMTDAPPDNQSTNNHRIYSKVIMKSFIWSSCGQKYSKQKMKKCKFNPTFSPVTAQQGCWWLTSSDFTVAWNSVSCLIWIRWTFSACWPEFSFWARSSATSASSPFSRRWSWAFSLSRASTRFPSRSESEPWYWATSSSLSFSRREIYITRSSIF